MTVMRFPYARCRAGVAVRDITAPVGIYARTWGAAAHDRADGVHRPMTATAAVFAPLAGDSPTLAVVAVDLGWFQNPEDERAVRDAILQRAGLSEDALLINLSHTHAGPNVNSKLTDVPGGELVRAYLDDLAVKLGEAVAEAKAGMAPAWVSFGHGRCDLARNRDYWDVPAARYACGFNPRAEADDTLLVARVTDEAGRILATVFNYACHPTTLAWENTLLSPDFVGAAREVLETTFGAPALFLQGASGDLEPMECYVGDVRVADRHGRRLGHAAVAAIEALPPAPATRLAYRGILPSGADLGLWSWETAGADDLAGADTLAARMRHVDLTRKPLPSITELEAALAVEPNRREQEKLRRRLFIQRTLGEASTHTMPFWVARLGQAALVAIPNEPYSILQTTLRARFKGVPLLIMGVTNGALGYLCPEDRYGRGIYQEQQSPFAPGCLEATIAAVADELGGMFETGTNGLIPSPSGRGLG